MDIKRIPAADVEEFLTHAAPLTVIRAVESGHVYECTTNDRWFAPGFPAVRSVEGLCRSGQDYLVLFDPNTHDYDGTTL